MKSVKFLVVDLKLNIVNFKNFIKKIIIKWKVKFLIADLKLNFVNLEQFIEIFRN